MYSLVVMAALTTGVETPDWGWKCGCSGYYSGCYGCWGCGGCYGCYGSGCWGCGGCYGGGCYGGGCWGCWGGYGYYNGCSGCYGCWGCYGCYGYSGYAPMYGPGPVMPGAPTGTPTEELGTPKKKEGTSVSPNRAKLLVEVPAEAKLFIDDQPIAMKATTKTFNTPELERGQSYYYILKVEVTRDGVAHSETRRVVIRAGDEVSARFTEEGVVTAARASASAR